MSVKIVRDAASNMPWVRWSVNVSGNNCEKGDRVEELLDAQDVRVQHVASIEQLQARS